MELLFCHRCGTKLHSKKHHFECENLHEIFPAPVPSVGAFLVNERNEIVMAVRGIEPRKGMLDAFGGFVDPDETLEVALARELEEELGLKAGQYSEPQFLVSAVGTYPYGGEAKAILAGLYWARIHSSVPITPLDDVGELYIRKLEDVEEERFHDDDIRVGFNKLKEVLLP